MGWVTAVVEGKWIQVGHGEDAEAARTTVFMSLKGRSGATHPDLPLARLAEYL